MKRKKLVLFGAISLILLCVLGVIYYKTAKTEKTDKKPLFKGFVEASTYIAEFDEIVNESERLVKLEIIRELESEEIMNLKGESERRLKSCTYFEAKILNDYYDSSRNGEKIFLSQDSNYEWQLQGNPVYELDKCFIMFLVKNRPEYDCWGPYAGMNSVFDVVETSEDTYLYKRLGDIPTEGLMMSQNEREVVTSTTENPTLYSKKVTLSSLLSVMDTYENK